ncbi:MAG: zinc metallopeptidase [Eubacteriaceae bacterium]|nr:zinc metallopeptidase [Eubacteriaceae bacterium]
MASYYAFMLPALILSLYAQIKVMTTFSKYSKVRNSRGITGSQAARMILEANGIRDVSIKQSRGAGQDFYHPLEKSVNLSNSHLNMASIAAIAVAAHECGHAMQHSQGYAMLAFRNRISKFATISSNVSWVLLFLGMALSSPSLLGFGIILFSAVVFFQIVTLPIEFDASRRAMVQLQELGLVANSQEASQSKKMLSAAALTYVAAMVTAIFELLRFISMFNRSRRR